MDIVEQLRRGPITNGLMLGAADEIERLRAALKWYAEATPEDFGKDNGFNANAALAQ